MAGSHFERSFPTRSFSKCVYLILGIVLCSGLASESAHAQSQAPLAGRNVNMVSGTRWPDGDPFLQRQNEPSIAVSTRNPSHILAGSNDYRTVDLKDTGTSRVIGDAWLGLYKSFDGGSTWYSTLLPGYPQDNSIDGVNSPLYQFGKDLPAGTMAGADATVRAGTNGLFYYSGIIFNRTKDSQKTGRSAVFVARFIDNNNLENGFVDKKNPQNGDAIQYLGAFLPDQINTDNGQEFIDKPWIAVDVPRAGGRVCTLQDSKGKKNDQIVPAGNVYLTYTRFLNIAETATRVMFTRSTDCGVTWSTPVQLSDSGRSSQGSTLAIDPRNGDLYIAWRQFSLGSTNPDGLFIVKSTDGGRTFTNARLITQIVPFDQGTKGGGTENDGSEQRRSFRTNAYPSMAVDDSGRVHIVWSQLGAGPAPSDRPNLREARIAIITSRDGISWPNTFQLVDDTAPHDKATGARHQIMPSLTFAAGKLVVVYYDARDTLDSVGVYAPGLADSPQPARITNPTNGGPSTLPFYNTIDVHAAQADPADTPAFLSTKVSKYLYAKIKRPDGKIDFRQLQFNAPNLPIFAGGTVPFIGDYIDIAPSPMFVTDDRGNWVYNTGKSNSSVFHAIWADNRDVRWPSLDLSGNYTWTTYAPPDYKRNPNQINEVSLYNGKTAVDACTPTSNPGSRNQNLYTARLTNGLIVLSPGNTKSLGSTPRTFVIWVQNATDKQRTVRLTIANQPRGGDASFEQFRLTTTVDVIIPRRSSIARTVFAKSKSEKNARVVVNVNEIATVSGPILADGLFGSVLLNPDILNPDILNPSGLGTLDIETHNPDILNTVQVTSLANPDILNPDILNPDILNRILNPDILNPDILNPDILNPDILNPDILNPDILNPDILNNILNPDILNPDILNPDILNPDILNPNIEVTDLAWTIENKGNTTSTYSINTLLDRAPKGFKFQLLIYKTAKTPVVSQCQPTVNSFQELVVNVASPDILNPDILNPDILNPDIRNATFYLAPEEQARVSLRVFDTDKRDQNKLVVPQAGATEVPADAVSFQEVVRDSAGNEQVITSQINTTSTSLAVNGDDAEDGLTQPPVATSLLTITSSSLPLAQEGVPYTETLTVSGETGSVTWQLDASLLPAGITFNSSTGVLSGTPAPGSARTYSIPVMATDQANPPQTAQGQITLTVAPPAGVASLSFVEQPSKVRVSAPITPPVSVAIFDAKGVPVSGRIVTIALQNNPTGAILSGVLTSTTGDNGVAVFPSLMLDKVGTGYTLRASASGFPDAISTAFDVIAKISLDPFTLAAAAVNTDYTASFQAAGGISPYTWTATGLPRGLAIDLYSGIIAGRPLEGGSFSVTVTVTDNGTPPQSDSKSGTLVVTATPLVIQTTSLPYAVAGSSYAAMVVANGGQPPLTWIVDEGTLPSGLNLGASDGIIRGTPTAGGTNFFFVRATDSLGTPARTQLSIRVENPLVITTSSPLPDGTGGTAYEQTLASAGGVGARTWTRISGALPAGISLSTAGVISGTPTEYGNFTFTVQVTDQDTPAQVTTKEFSLFIQDPNALRILTSTIGTSSRGTRQFPLVAAGGSPPYTWTQVGGSLPPGILLTTRVPQTFPSTTGLIGVATTPGAYNFRLQVQDSAGATVQRDFTMTIAALSAIDVFALPAGSVGNAYSYSLQAAGNQGAVIWTLATTTSIVPGLTVNSSGQITGTPTAAGLYTFLMSLADSTGVTILRSYNIAVTSLRVTSPAALPNATVNQSYSGILTATGGTPPYTWTLVSGTLPAPLSLTTDGIISGVVSNLPGTHRFTVSVADSSGKSVSKNFSLNVIGIPEVLPSTVTIRLEDFTVGNSRSITINGTGGTAPFTWSSTNLPPGLSLTESAGSPPDATLAGTVLSAGTYTFTIHLTDSSVPPITISRQYTLQVSQLDLTPPAPGTIGIPYSFSIRPIGGVGPWTVQNLSALATGLTMDATGLISGTPSESGFFRIRVVVTDGQGAQLIRTVSLQIDAPISINSPNNLLNDATLGQSYSTALSATGGSSFTWSHPGSTLPQGLTLSTASGTISGTPTVAGTFTFTIRATDAADPQRYGARTFTLVVTPLSLTSRSRLVNATIGVPYSAQLVATGGTPPYSWSIESPNSALPSGLTISGSTISGTPDANSGGHHNFTLMLRDSAGHTRNVTLSLAVYPTTAPPTIFNRTSFGVRSIGTAQLELLAGSDNGPITWSVDPGSSLPAGFAVRTDVPSFFANQTNGAGIIGVGTTPGDYSFILRATDSNGIFTRQLFNLTITSLLIRDLFTLPDAFAGAPYSHTFTSSSQGTVQWNVQSGTTLPQGMSLSSAGVLSGTPTVSGLHTIRLSVTEGSTTLNRNADLFIAPVRITTDGALPQGTQGQAYTAVTFNAEPAGNYVWTASTLPAGMSFTPGGVLSGTPNFAGAGHFAVTATDQVTQKSYTKQMTLNVIGVPPILPSITTLNDLSDITLGVPRSIEIHASGGVAPYNWTAQGLPPGMALRSSGTSSFIRPFNAELWGTPSQLGTYNVTFTITDSSNPPVTTSQTYPVAIKDLDNDSLGSSTSITRGVPFSFNVRALGGTGSGYTWAIAPSRHGQLPHGVSLNPQTGVLSGTPLEDGFAFPRISIANGDRILQRYLGFTVGNPNSPLSISSSQTLPPAMLNQPFTFTLNAYGAPTISWSILTLAIYNSTVPPGMSLSSDGVFSGTPTATGTYSFSVKAADQANANSYSIRRFTITVTPVLITTASLEEATLGQPYSATLQATGGTAPYVFALAAESLLPPGLSLTGNGVLSGTPTSTGRYSFRVFAQDSSGVLTWRDFSLSVYVVAPLKITTLQSDVPAAIVGTPYLFTFAGTGGTAPRSFNANPNPVAPGLVMHAIGEVSGTPTTSGTFNFNVTLRDSGNPPLTVNKDFSITVRDPLIVTTATLPDGIVGSTYAAAIGVTGGDGSVSCSISSGALPPGVNLNGCALSGRPTVAGTFTFTLSARDSSQPTAQVATKVLSIVVGAPLVITSSDPTLSEKFYASHGTAHPTEVYRYRLDSSGDPVLEQIFTHSSFYSPSWMEFSPSGELFLVNHGIGGPGDGNLSRFLSAYNSPTHNGVVSSASFNFPVSAAFRNGEMFVVQGGAQNILRFLFDGSGAAIANGSIPVGDSSIRGIAVSPWGELFVSAQSSNKIYRFTIDSAGSASANGVITASLNGPSDLIFRPIGNELYVANAFGNSIVSFSFDGNRNASHLQTVTGNGLNTPLGLGWDNAGRLWVSNNGEGTISRFKFAIGPLVADTVFAAAAILGDLDFIPRDPVPDGTVGQPYNYALRAQGGARPLTWSLAPGSTLPPNMELTSAGVLRVVAGQSGPGAAGTYTFTAQATDGGVQLVVKELKIRIADPLVLSSRTWTKLTPTPDGTYGTPSARGSQGVTAVYDPGSNRLIVFGGRSASGSHNDVWALTNANGTGGTPQWINLIADGATGSPAARAGHTAVYDPATNKMIVFGGCNGVCVPVLNDVWVLSNANGLGGTPGWTQLNPSGTPPQARNQHVAVYDSRNNAMVIFSGHNGLVGDATGTLQDVWRLTFANGSGGTPAWTQLSPGGISPGGFAAASAVYDPGFRRMIVFGGNAGPAGGGAASSAVWALVHATGFGGTPTWENISTDGPPPARAGHSAAYDEVDKTMVVFGGDFRTDTWMLRNALGVPGPSPTWTRLYTEGASIPGRSFQGTGYDPVTKSMIVFGGGCCGTLLNDVWVLKNDPQTPAPLATTAVAYSHTLRASGGIAPYTFSKIGGTAAWASITTAGVVTGTPAAPGVYSLSTRVTDSGGRIADYTLDIRVSDSSAASATPPSLTAWWPLEGNADDIVDRNHGVVNGAIFVTGKVGQALSFDGVDDYVVRNPGVTSQSLSPIGDTGEISIEAWVKIGQYPSSITPIVTKGSSSGGWEYALRMTNNGRPHFEIIQSNGVQHLLIAGTSSLSLNSWNHVVGTSVVHAGQQFIRVYLNGALVGESAAVFGSPGPPTTEPLYIGKMSTGEHFNGLLDEVTIYNRALTGNQIQTLYNAGSSGKARP